MVFVKILTFLKSNCQKNLEKNCGRPVFKKSWQAARNFSKVALDFNKTPNFLRQVLQAYSEICIFCVPKNVLQKLSAKTALKYQGNLVIKFDDNVIKFIL